MKLVDVLNTRNQRIISEALELPEALDMAKDRGGLRFLVFESPEHYHDATRLDHEYLTARDFIDKYGDTIDN